ncbi:hypothetical protein L4C34_01120 [Vibrio profundum]|uniref:hypothetical protein n=1 Tax=Vibrio profundum TaxID=2910247 RepID=UPI003D1500C9
MMTLNKNAHGNFTFDLLYLNERIIKQVATGSWNIQTAEDWFSQINIVIDERLSETQWAILNDITRWDLCPPDVMEYFNQCLIQFSDKKMCRLAVITKMSLQNMAAKHSTESVNGTSIIIQYFAEEQQALSWLRSELESLC